MEHSHRSHRIRISLPVRIRGMSSAQKFFDEQTETVLISDHEVMTRIRSLVDLETEIHLTSLKTNLGATFRVMWLNTQPREEFHEVGLEIVEQEGDLWEMTFPAAAAPENDPLAECWLECRRCYQRVLAAVPEAEDEFIREGFRVARPCEDCKATTAWEFSPAGDTDASEGGAERKLPELRGKGRAPLRIRLKIIRKRYGTAIDDIRETENVSRSGAYFFTAQHYEVGEDVDAVLPYKEEDVSISMPARVVRVDRPADSPYQGVAIHIHAEHNL